MYQNSEPHHININSQYHTTPNTHMRVEDGIVWTFLL